jgi:hypothetical protein
VCYLGCYDFMIAFYDFDVFGAHGLICFLGFGLTLG